MAADCLFCKIVAGDVPSNPAYEDEHVFGFHDIDPKAETHVLLVPKKHYADLTDLAQDAETAAALIVGIRGFARQEGLTDFRTVFNTGAGVGQTVFHVHAHVLAGRSFGWPPG